MKLLGAQEFHNAQTFEGSDNRAQAYPGNNTDDKINENRNSSSHGDKLYGRGNASDHRSKPAASAPNIR